MENIYEKDIYIDSFEETNYSGIVFSTKHLSGYGILVLYDVLKNENIGRVYRTTSLLTNDCDLFWIANEDLQIGSSINDVEGDYENFKIIDLKYDESKNKFFYRVFANWSYMNCKLKFNFVNNSNEKSVTISVRTGVDETKIIVMTGEEVYPMMESFRPFIEKFNEIF